THMGTDAAAHPDALAGLYGTWRPQPPEYCLAARWAHWRHRLGTGGPERTTSTGSVLFSDVCRFCLGGCREYRRLYRRVPANVLRGGGVGFAVGRGLCQRGRPLVAAVNCVVCRLLGSLRRWITRPAGGRAGQR